MSGSYIGAPFSATAGYENQLAACLFEPFQCNNSAIVDGSVVRECAVIVDRGARKYIYDPHTEEYAANGIGQCLHKTAITDGSRLRC